MVLIVSLLIVAVTTAALYAIAQWRPSASAAVASPSASAPAPGTPCTRLCQPMAVTRCLFRGTCERISCTCAYSHTCIHRYVCMSTRGRQSQSHAEPGLDRRRVD